MSISMIGNAGNTALRKMTLGKLAKNSWTLLRNEAHTAAQKPIGLKNQAVIYATVVMVLSRIFIAFGSAEKERNPEKKHYLFSQFLETTFREGMGMTTNYFVLRLIERLSKGAMNKVFGTKYPPKAPGFLSKLKHEISDYCHGKLRTPTDHPKLDLSPDYGYTRDLIDFENKALYQKVEKPFRWVAEKFNPGKQISEPNKILAENIKLLPVLCLGTPIAIATSGFWLEWFNQTRFNTVYANILKFLKLDKTEADANQAKPPVQQPRQITPPPSPFQPTNANPGLTQ